MSLISMWTHFCWGSCLGADGAAGGPRGLAFPDCLSVDTNLERRHAGHPVTDGKLMGRGLTLSPSTEPHWGQPWLRSGVYAPVPVRS